MATSTTNYGYIKTGENEIFDVNQLNENMDMIDRDMKNREDAISMHSNNTNIHTTLEEQSKLAGIQDKANNYIHPSYNAKSSGLYKITVDGKGHVSGTNAVAKIDITELGIPAQDTIYTAGTGIAVDDTVINHSNSVTAGTAQGEADKTLTYGGTFAVPSVTYDGQGHITGKGTTTMTMPAVPTDIPGNAETATKLKTARSLTVGNTGKPFNGEDDVSWSFDDIENSTHRFVTDAEKNTWNSKQDALTIDSALSSTSTNPVQNKVVNTALTGKSDTSHTHSYAGSSSSGGAATTALACTGNAATATKLQTAKTLTVGNTGKTFDGSTNVNWTFDDIENSTHRFVTDEEKVSWNGAVEKAVENASKIEELNKNLINRIYPVGSIYMSVNSESPATLIGGTWAALQDRFLIGAGGTYAVNGTGGTATHILTPSEMPSHTHTFTGSSVTSGNNSAGHTHSIPALSGTAASGGAHTHALKYQSDANASGSMRRVVNNGASGTLKANDADGEHTHTVTTTASTSGGVSANHTHSVTASGSNSNTGGGGAHNNMPPYLAVYMWKRTA